MERKGTTLPFYVYYNCKNVSFFFTFSLFPSPSLCGSTQCLTKCCCFGVFIPFCIHSLSYVMDWVEFFRQCVYHLLSAQCLEWVHAAIFDISLCRKISMKYFCWTSGRRKNCHIQFILLSLAQVFLMSNIQYGLSVHTPSSVTKRTELSWVA
jgi:hypothetical protein